jgi:IS30 family transposase
VRDIKKIKKNKAIRLTAEVKRYISEKLKEYWSPQQIVGRLELDRKIKISTETAIALSLWTKR